MSVLAVNVVIEWMAGNFSTTRATIYVDIKEIFYIYLYCRSKSVVHLYGAAANCQICTLFVFSSCQFTCNPLSCHRLEPTLLCWTFPLLIAMPCLCSSILLSCSLFINDVITREGGAGFLHNLSPFSSYLFLLQFDSSLPSALSGRKFTSSQKSGDLPEIPAGYRKPHSLLFRSRLGKIGTRPDHIFTLKLPGRWRWKFV